MQYIFPFISDFFQSTPLSLPALEALVAICDIKRLQAGDILFDADDVVEAFFWLREGSVLLRCTKSGEMQTIRAGELMAHHQAFLSQPVYEASAVALQASTAIRVNADRFLTIIHEFPEVALNLLAIKARELPLLGNRDDSYSPQCIDRYQPETNDDYRNDINPNSTVWHSLPMTFLAE